MSLSLKSICVNLNTEKFLSPLSLWHKELFQICYFSLVYHWRMHLSTDVCYVTLPGLHSVWASLSVTTHTWHRHDNHTNLRKVLASSGWCWVGMHFLSQIAGTQLKKSLILEPKIFTTIDNFNLEATRNITFFSFASLKSCTLGKHKYTI